MWAWATGGRHFLGAGGKRKMGGRNAAKSVRSGLTFIQDHIEIGLAADDPDVVTSGLLYPVAERGQAEVALISDLFLLGTMTRSANKVGGFVAMGRLVIIRGGCSLRAQHSFNAQNV